MSVKEVQPYPPDQDVIDYLEHLLERARSGEIQTIAVAIGKKAYYTTNGWAGMGKANMSIVGEVEALKIDIMRYFVEQRIEYIERWRD